MKMLRVFMGEKDHYKKYPMYEYILKQCYKLGIAGATVFKGIMGYGQKRHIHRSDFFTLSGDFPIVIEIIDTEDNIQKIREMIEQLPFDGILTVADLDATIISNK